MSLADRQLDWKSRAVFALGHGFATDADHFFEAGSQVGAEKVIMSVPVSLGHEDINAFPDNLRRCPAEYFFSGRIE